VCFAGHGHTGDFDTCSEPGDFPLIFLGFFGDSKQVKALTSHTFLDLPRVVCHLMSSQQKRYTNSQRNFKLAKINRNWNFAFLGISSFSGGSGGRTFVGDSV